MEDVLSADQRWAIAHILHLNGLIDRPLPGRAPEMRPRYVGTFPDGLMSVERYEITSSIRRRGIVHNFTSVVDVSARGA
ncbi:MAG: hypothetical protein JO101_11130, partial [Candidatus Eremiobacteraeota bacterium]|nr:hypothetical protein [Candidatus Eremiobacteraeota bacterium]MBV8355865.1 hypothetical protein [Candidatus Eremiobacteraeota bacterium]